jgi:L-glyceraldehyde 3-phosphate reductase
MALSWVLKDPRITSVLIGARNKEQLLDSFKCIENTDFSLEELNIIDELLAKY